MRTVRGSVFRTAAIAGAVALGATGLVGCSADDATETTTATDASSLAIDSTQWSYDADNDVYYQIGNLYVEDPQAEDYETLGIYVPGAYMTATDNGDGTYTAEINAEGTVGDFTGETAPIVFPVNTPGYASQAAPTEYSYDTVSQYMEAGMIYVQAGLRGKDSNTEEYDGNAPWGVTDLKAAVRYIRYNDSEVPGDTDAVYVFGHSGGGAQSSIMGASGDSELYTAYLEELGAAMTDADGNAISDAVAGVMAWCPITALDIADEAYEWNMGQFSEDGTRADGTWTAEFSDDLAASFADYINAIGLTDEDGTALTLDESEEGIYLSGTYYEEVMSTIEDSLNDFLSVTEFPYTESTSFQAGMDATGADVAGDMAGAPTGDVADGEMPEGDFPTDGEMPEGDMAEGGMAGGPGGDSTEEAATYDTVQDYIDSLNADTEWVSYDESTNTATVLSLDGFVDSEKTASKDVGAFDSPDASATENVVMGDGEDGMHFDAYSLAILAANEDEYATFADWSDDYSASAYEADIEATDDLGNDSTYRMNMYNPMYFLSDYYEGYETATVAANWRIRTGIQQGDTALTTEMNLALALEAYGVESVDFATIWGQGHTMAELTGDGESNFIAWVTEIEG